MSAIVPRHLSSNQVRNARTRARLLTELAGRQCRHCSGPIPLPESFIGASSRVYCSPGCRYNARREKYRGRIRYRERSHHAQDFGRLCRLCCGLPHRRLKPGCPTCGEPWAPDRIDAEPFLRAHGNLARCMGKSEPTSWEAT